jgi:ubiquinone/menaquinone biosynthesis C-methylase UbiE
MAGSVGRDGSVCGIDISEDMLAMSRKRCANQPWTESTQVYEYVADIRAALAEIYRVTRPGGRMVVLDTDYVSLVIHTGDETRMARVLSAWDEHFVHAGLPRVLSGHLRNAGFAIRQRDVIPMFNPEYHDNTYAKQALGS